MINIAEIMRIAEENEASDIHLTVNLPPMIRIAGQLLPVGDERLSPAETEQVVRQLLSREQFESFQGCGEIDLAVSVPGQSRFRLNAFKQRGTCAVAMRRVSTVIKSLQELNLPEKIASFARLSRGLVLVTGPTGSGKTTTLASLIDLINCERSAHVITLEDPIEFLHRHNKSMINQREVGHDTASFSTALRSALREDPDIILVGEMRDLETIAITLTAAETGHLVFSTLHTIGAAETIDRIIDVFPPSQQSQIRTQLSMTLQGVVSQQLIPTISGWRTVAVEVMVATDAIRNLIRENKIPQINNAIMTGSSAGMISMDRSILDLYAQKLISREDALTYCVDPNFMRRNLL